MNYAERWTDRDQHSAGAQLLDRPPQEVETDALPQTAARAAAAPPLVCSTLAEGDRFGRRCYYAVLATVAVLTCLPVWLVEYPPLVDYPNHLARNYIRQAGGDIALFAERYTFDHTPVPALGMDAVMAALQTVLDVYSAGKVFVTITLLAYLLGGHLLGWAIHGRPTWLALATALFAYHSMFFYGYTNYSLSLGMFLVALAGWLTWSRRPTAATLLLFQLLVLVCYFTHLAGFLLLGGAVGVIGVWRGVCERRMAAYSMTMLPLVVPVVLFVAFRPAASSHEGILWSTLTEKLIGALCLVRTYSTRLDVMYLLVLAALVTATALSLRRVRCDVGVLLAGLAFVTMFVIGPKEINGGGAPADARFLPAAAPLLLLAPQLTLRRRRAVLLLAALVGMIAVRTTVIAREWQPLDRALAVQVSLFQHVREGATLYPIVALTDDTATNKRNLALWHAVHYATVERHTYSPGLLAYPGQQTIRYRHQPTWMHPSAERFPDLDAVDWERIFARYDYLWCYRVPPDYRAFLERRCTVVASGGDGVIFQAPSH